MISIVCCLAVYSAWKIRYVHRTLYSLGDRFTQDLLNQFSQLEALFSLYIEIKPELALGSTRSFAASPDILLLLARKILELKPKVVVECGSGVSTVVIARCLQLNGQGKLISVDHESSYAEQTRVELDRMGLSEWAVVHHAELTEGVFGSGRQDWYNTSAFPNDGIDLAFIDGPPVLLGPRARYPAGPFLLPKMNPTGMMILDDASRPEEAEIVKQWKALFPDWTVEMLPLEKGAAILKRRQSDT